MIELEEYAQSLENKFIPFSLFKKVIEEQAKFDSIPELLILRNKILRYEQFGLFAETEEQFRIFNDYLAKSTITTVDSSSVDEKYQKLILKIITSQINKKCYLIFNVTDYNTDKQTIAQIYDNNNIRPVVTSSYSYKYAPFLKSHCKNSVLFAPVDKRTDDDGYGLFQNKLRQKEFIVYGENTFYMPLILKLEAIDKNIFEKLLDAEIKDDVDKFILHSSAKKDDNVIQNITDKDPSTIKFEAGTKRTPSIKPVNYVVQQTSTFPSVKEEKQFSEILKEETLIDGYTAESDEKNTVYDMDSQGIVTNENISKLEEDIEDNIVYPENIRQAYQEATETEINSEDKNNTDLLISDEIPELKPEEKKEDFILDFSETATVETEIEPKSEEAKIEPKSEDKNEIVFQEQIKVDDIQPEVMDTAEEIFQQVVTEPEIKPESTQEEPQNIQEEPKNIKEETKSILEGTETLNLPDFEETDLSNIKLDFSLTDEIVDLKKNDNTEEIKEEISDINQKVQDDITNDDLDFLD